MRILAARSESDRPVSEPPRLALQARETIAEVQNDVVPRVLAEGDEKSQTELLEREHDREGRAISN